MCGHCPNFSNFMNEKLKENPRLNKEPLGRFSPGCLTDRLTSSAKIGRISHSSQSKAALVEAKHWQREMEEMGVVGGCCTLALAYVSLIFQQSKLRLNTSMQHSMLRFGLQRDTHWPRSLHSSEPRLRYLHIFPTFHVVKTQGAPPVILLHCPVVKKKVLDLVNSPLLSLSQVQ